MRSTWAIAFAAVFAATAAAAGASNSSCTVQVGKIIGRSTIGSHTGATAAQCCALCDADAECQAWTVSYPGNITNGTLPTATGTCYLKDNTKPPGVHANGTHASGARSGPAPPGPPGPTPVTPSCCHKGRWISAWGQCRQLDIIVNKTKVHPGIIGSILLYGGGLRVGADGTAGTINTTCQAAIEANGPRIEPVLGHDGIHTVLGNDTLTAAFIADLGKQVAAHNIYGVTLDWEKVLDKRLEGKFKRFLGAMRAELNSHGARLTMYTNGEGLYSDWAAYFNFTDRLLDGSCYESESAQHWREACRPVHGLPHADHQAPALLSSWTGGKPGKWGYTNAAAALKTQTAEAHGLSELAMFNLESMAEWWWPHLAAFLHNTTTTTSAAT